MEKHGMEKLKLWIAIIVPVLTLLAGSGWLKYLIERREASRSEHREVLESFLIPLQAILEQNGLVHDALTRDQEFKRLEHAPDYLQKYFAKLPDTDSRKIAWKALIEGLLRDNRRAAELIQRNSGRILLADFRKACTDFVYHANEWDAMWQSVWSGQPVPDKFRKAGVLAVRPFPEQMDSLLELEIAERRQKAGI